MLQKEKQGGYTLNYNNKDIGSCVKIINLNRIQ